jgi:hypothetical protein
MNTRGIPAHCSATAVIADGRVVVVTQEKRLSERKESCGFQSRRHDIA